MSKADEIIKAVNAIPVCADGRRAILRLVKLLIPLTLPDSPALGQVWSNGHGGIYLLLENDQATCLKSGGSFTTVGKIYEYKSARWGEGSTQKLANSLKEYVDNGGKL